MKISKRNIKKIESSRPNLTEKQIEKIKQTAQRTLDALALYPDSSPAYLYNEVTMPSELCNAHRANDKAVMDTAFRVN